MTAVMRQAVDRLYATPALLLTLTALFWAGNAIAGQLAVGEVRPFLLVFLRWLLVSVVLWALFGAEVRNCWQAVRSRIWLVVVMSCIGFTAFNALFYVASYRTTAVNIGILQGSIPVFVLIGAFFAHGARITRLQLVGVLGTLAGVVLVATQGAPLRILDQGANPGDLLMLLACFLYASYTVLLRDRPAIPGRAFFTLMTPIAAISSLPLAVAEAAVRGPEMPTAAGWAVTLYVAIFPSCIAQLFFLRGVDLIGPGRAGVFVNLVPVFAALLAVVLLGQTFAPFHALALALVIGGIWLTQRAGARKKGAPERP